MNDTPTPPPSAPVADWAIATWDLPTDTRATLINLSENATYRLDDGRGQPRGALRLHRPGYQDPAAIRSELAWVRAIQTEGDVHPPRPLAGRDGALIQSWPGTAGHGARQAVLFAWEPGEEPREDSPELKHHFVELGAVAARLHRQVAGWTPPADFTRQTWDLDTTLGDRPLWGDWRQGIGMDGETERLFGRTIERLARRLDSLGRAAEHFSLCHADLRLANLLVAGPRLTVLDFDDCGFTWHLYDAATTVSFFEHHPEVPELLAAWVRGYRQVRPLSDDEVGEIPSFVLLRRLLLVAWIGSHQEAPLARQLGAAYTAGSAELCRAYLARH
ncbi:phosphotransferase enzyme family protein [Roseospirillum parvum]|uniref:Ser/Thr protein kinase RdoA involved in Cpx stress response, MazF antagonist n=1 Tax=Roseospirillum parvum TaxID=83401 RepID=A0A1G7XSF8_9PROT|nr:phosphotransferase [Roseospirillum parvum]SDG87175.1 Ser/Thr protein kinase RdoA involved in Cpx stress response, MazF antagonist [Roseospirillum parvum]